MIPYIRSLTELMAITESREMQKGDSSNNKKIKATINEGGRQRDIRSSNKKEVILPDLPKIIRHKWRHNKLKVSRFFDDLDYNNQIQASYDLTLLENQNRNQQDVA